MTKPLARPHPSRLARMPRRFRIAAADEWAKGRGAVILVLLYAGLVLIDGLLVIGLFGLLEAMGLNEPTRLESVGRGG